MKRIRDLYRREFLRQCFMQFSAVTLNSLTERVLLKIKSAEYCTS